jgi:hypothetical protein
MLQFLYRRFDYLASPEFEALARGKSDDYRRMLAKTWSSPEKRTQTLKDFANSMAALLVDDRAYELTRTEHHTMLDDLRINFGSITNPDGDDAE